MTNQQIAEDLLAKFGENVSSFEEPWGLLTFSTNRQNIISVLNYDGMPITADHIVNTIKSKA